MEQWRRWGYGDGVWSEKRSWAWWGVAILRCRQIANGRLVMPRATYNTRQGAKMLSSSSLQTLSLSRLQIASAPKWLSRQIQSNETNHPTGQRQSHRSCCGLGEAEKLRYTLVGGRGHRFGRERVRACVCTPFRAWTFQSGKGSIWLMTFTLCLSCISQS